MNKKNSYMELCQGLIDVLGFIHDNNKKYRRRGLIMLVILPILLLIMKAITGFSTTSIMFIWLFCLFMDSSFLVFIEYIDARMLSKLEALIGPEEEWGRFAAQAAGEAENDPAEEEAEVEPSGEAELEPVTEFAELEEIPVLEPEPVVQEEELATEDVDASEPEPVVQEEETEKDAASQEEVSL